MVSASSSVTNIVKTVVPFVVFSFTLPVLEVITEPPIPEVLNFGAVFGITLM